MKPTNDKEIVMQRYFCFLFIFFFSLATHADVLLFEDFEDSVVTYTTSIAEFSDGDSDYFGRIAPDALSIASTIAFTNVQGSGYFAAMDTDAPEGSTDDGVLSLSVDISGYESLRFSALFAEDIAADGNPDWDADTSVNIRYDIDGGIAQTLMAFESVAGTNTHAAEDTDFDGLGDGNLLSDQFTWFESAINGSGNTLNLQISLINLNAGDEDIAFDNILIEGDLGTTPVPIPASAWLLLSGLMGLMANRRNSTG